MRSPSSSTAARRPTGGWRAFDFDGTTWMVPKTALSEITEPLLPGVEPGVDGETVTHTFELAGLDGALLPEAFMPVRVEGQVGVAFDAEGPSSTTSGTSDGLVSPSTRCCPAATPTVRGAADAGPTGSRAEYHLARCPDTSRQSWSTRPA